MELPRNFKCDDDSIAISVIKDKINDIGEELDKLEKLIEEADSISARINHIEDKLDLILEHLKPFLHPLDQRKLMK